MTFRSIIIGLGLALFISVATYYHSSVMRQVSLSGSLFPPAVIGFLVLVVLGWNPLVRRFSLRPGELAVIAALVLAACYWPGSVFNNLLNKLALPAHWQKVESAWVAADVMSYVPGGSVELGEGHVQDWETLAEGITALDNDHSLRAGFSSRGLRSLERLAEGEQLEVDSLSLLRGELNRWIEAGGAEREARALRRAELVRWFPTSVLPPPEGALLLPEGGAASPEVTDQYLGGGSDSLGSLVPWSTWLPVFGLWVGIGLLLAGAALGLTIIVHPQWSRRELLPYPVVTFIREITQPDPQGGRWPQIANNKAFWVGLVTIFAVRLVNALHEWFPEVVFVTIPLRLDFRALQELLPTAAQVPGSVWVFSPQFDPVLIAFAVFLSRSVSLSLGLAGVVWLAWGTFLLSRGVHAGSDLFGDGPTNLMLFGAYVGAAAMVFYVGRRHYIAVAKAAIGLHHAEVSPLWAWAGRWVALCGVAATILLATLGGLDWPFAVLTVAMTGVIYLIVARIHVETGAIFIHTFWFSSSILPALLGDMAVGPTNLIVMFLFTLVLVEGTQSAIMPMLADGWKLCDDLTGRVTGKLAGWLSISVVLSGVAAGVGVLIMGYQYGAPMINQWGFRMQPAAPFDRLARLTSDLSSTGELAEATAAGGLERLFLIDPSYENFGWVGLGLGLVVLCAVMRLRVVWWPIHPVLFLMLGTFYGYRYAPSFLMGWAFKSFAVSIAGTRAYTVLKAVMIGVISGEMLAIFGWMIIHAFYFFLTGKTPPVIM